MIVLNKENSGNVPLQADFFNIPLGWLDRVHAEAVVGVKRPGDLMRIGGMEGPIPCNPGPSSEFQGKESRRMGGFDFPGIMSGWGSRDFSKTFRPP